MSIHPNTGIGHVHLTVSDLDRALAFYRDVLGFEVTSRYGRDAVFLSAGGYHHHIGLNTWAGRGAPAPPRGTTGLYHFAILYPDRKALAGAVRRVLDAGVPLEGAADHGVSEAIYLRDPDGNGVELYRDRPESEWPRAADGTIAMSTRVLSRSTTESAPSRATGASTARHSPSRSVRPCSACPVIAPVPLSSTMTAWIESASAACASAYLRDPIRPCSSPVKSTNRMVRFGFKPDRAMMRAASSVHIAPVPLSVVPVPSSQESRCAPTMTT